MTTSPPPVTSKVLNSLPPLELLSHRSEMVTTLALITLALLGTALAAQFGAFSAPLGVKLMLWAATGACGLAMTSLVAMRSISTKPPQKVANGVVPPPQEANEIMGIIKTNKDTIYQANSLKFKVSNRDINKATEIIKKTNYKHMLIFSDDNSVMHLVWDGREVVVSPLKTSKHLDLFKNKKRFGVV